MLKCISNTIGSLNSAAFRVTARNSCIPRGCFTAQVGGFGGGAFSRLILGIAVQCKDSPGGPRVKATEALHACECSINKRKKVPSHNTMFCTAQTVMVWFARCVGFLRLVASVGLCG